MKMAPMRPQILVAIVLLGLIAGFSIWVLRVNEIAGVCAAGIIALAKDIIGTDNMEQ
jgi:F0F1-type ATP synthase assembly protein I